MPNEKLRYVILRPYRKGAGHTFNLRTWDTGRRDWRGQTVIGYAFREGRAVLAEGEDFAGSPMHADDSNACIGSLLTFLTLRRGDIDADFFANDSEAMRDFRETHAEPLAGYCADRFGER